MKTPIFPGWWQVVVAFIIQAVAAASIFTAYSIIAVPLQEAFEPSRMVLMLGVTAVVLGSGLLSPVFGPAIDRYSVRALMLAGSASMAIGFWLLSITTSMTQVIVVYAVFMSVSMVLLGPMTASALLARWFTRRIGFAMGIAASGTAVGGLLIPPLLQGLIDGVEWRMALQIFGTVVFLITAPIIGLLVINKPSDRNLFADGDSEPPAVSETPVDASLVSASALFRSANFWLASIMLCLIFAGGISVISNLLPLVVGKGIDPAKGAILLSIYSGANFGGKLLCAALVDRFDCRWVFAAMLSVLTLGAFCFLQADSYTMLVFASLIMGLSTGGALPFWSVFLAQAYGPENIGRVMGLMTVVIMPANLVGAPLFGLIHDRTGSYDYAFIGYIVLLVIAILLVPQLRTAGPKVEGQPSTVPG